VGYYGMGVVVRYASGGCFQWLACLPACLSE